MGEYRISKFVELYKSLGFSIIPLAHRSKKPVVEWTEYQKRKPTDDELKQWFSRDEINIGIVCGSVSNGLIILDFESADGLERFFEKTPEELAKETLVVKTARGYHVYFRSSKNMRGFKIEELKLDVRADGNYVAAPPSIHPTGVTYEFLGNPWEIDEVPMVENLESFIWSRANELGVFRYGSNEDPPCIRRLLEGVDEGARNESAVRLASYWLYFKNIDVSKAWRQLQDWNTRNRPPLDEKELKTCFQSVLKHGYEYGCSSMKSLGVCNGKMEDVCRIRGGFKVEKKTVKHVPSIVLSDGRIVEEAWRDNKAFFITYNPTDGSIRELEEVEDGGIIYKPLVNRDLETGQVMLPSKAEEYTNDVSLFEEVRAFLDKWHEQPDRFERTLDVLYTFLSWVYDALPQIPYRRALGRWGSGKSAWVETVGSICYRPIILAGCDSEASLRRTFDLWRGTALIDEADFSESSLYASIVKILNIGYSKALGWYRCCNDKDPGKIDSFYVYGPKLLATRSEFKDVALESRCLTFISRKGSGEAPLYRAEQFRAEALELRNKLLLWRFRNYGRVVEVAKELEKQGLFKEAFSGKVEPRIAQIILPLALVFENPELRKALIAMAESKSEEVRALDPDVWLEEEVPTVIKEMLKEGLDGKTGEGEHTGILSKVDVVDLVDVFKQGPNLQRSRKLTPLKIRDIAERLIGENNDESELKSTAKKVSAFIRKQLGFMVKKSTGGYFYAFIPEDFLKEESKNTRLPVENPLNPLNPPEGVPTAPHPVGSEEKEAAVTKPAQSVKPTSNSSSKPDDSTEVFEGALEGYVCVKCGRHASKVIKIRGTQEAICDSCLSRISSELTLGERIKNAKDAYRRLETGGLNMVEESVFLNALKQFDAEPEVLLRHLIEQGRVFRPKDGWIRWVSD